MNKRRWIWLFVILLIVILLGSVVVKHWNSIEALVDSFRYSQEDVLDKLNKNKEELQQYIDETEDITVRDLTDEEAKALNEGNLTEEEAVAILTGQETKPSANNNAEPTPTPTPTEKPVNTVVSEAIAKLYIQKNTYLNKLDTIEAQVRAEYIAIVKGSNMTDEEKKAEKNGFLKRNLSTVAAWEKECDSVVYGILDEIETALKESGEDTSVVKKLEEAYLNEKRLKKSYFINRYMD